MPNYAFECVNGHTFDQIVRWGTDKVPCQQCGAEATQDPTANARGMSFRFNYMEPSE